MNIQWKTQISFKIKKKNVQDISLSVDGTVRSVMSIVWHLFIIVFISTRSIFLFHTTESQIIRLKDC